MASCGGNFEELMLKFLRLQITDWLGIIRFICSLQKPAKAVSTWLARLGKCF